MLGEFFFCLKLIKLVAEREEMGDDHAVCHISCHIGYEKIGAQALKNKGFLMLDRVTFEVTLLFEMR